MRPVVALSMAVCCLLAASAPAIALPHEDGPSDPSTVSNRTVVGLQVRVTATPNGSLSPDVVFETVATGRRSLRIAGRNERLNVDIRPEVGAPATAGQAARGDPHMAVEERASRRVVFHEYVHTRQEFRTTRRTRWLVEAMASYYADRYAVEACGRANVPYDYEAFRADLNTSDNRTVLSKPDTWRLEADYEKGEAVLAVLDWRIRSETGGNATLATVFRQLESRNVTHARLQQTVRQVAGAQTARWFDTHATTDMVPDTGRLPANASAFGFADAPSCSLVGVTPSGQGKSSWGSDLASALGEPLRGTPLEPFAATLATRLPVNHLAAGGAIAVALAGFALFVFSPVLVVVAATKLVRLLRRLRNG
jgi:hypothetical protein